MLAWNLNKVYNSVLRQGGTADDHMPLLLGYL
jgi:hypothetical protein